MLVAAQSMGMAVRDLFRGCWPDFDYLDAEAQGHPRHLVIEVNRHSVVIDLRLKTVWGLDRCLPP